jgi:hypothetical protein
VLQLQKQIEQENLAQVVAYDHLPTDIEKSIPTNFSGTQRIRKLQCPCTMISPHSARAQEVNNGK